MDNPFVITIFSREMNGVLVVHDLEGCKSKLRWMINSNKEKVKPVNIMDAIGSKIVEGSLGSGTYVNDTTHFIVTLNSIKGFCTIVNQYS